MEEALRKVGKGAFFLPTGDEFMSMRSMAAGNLDSADACV